MNKEYDPNKQYLSYLEIFKLIDSDYISKDAKQKIIEDNLHPEANVKLEIQHPNEYIIVYRSNFDRNSLVILFDGYRKFHLMTYDNYIDYIDNIDYDDTSFTVKCENDPNQGLFI